ncbi:MAG: YdcF family protein [Verrucomicrobia bacterium]|nr:YdcF family protein [Leptolyngbya sp. ES-bin-22]
MKVLILLTLIGVLWLISSRRWRRGFLNPLAIVIIIYLGITSPLGVALATQGLTAPLPTDAGESVDSIVVLGRGDDFRNRRIEIAEHLWRDKRSSKIFASGMLDAEFIIEQLKKNGVAAPALSGERCSQSTEENALFTAAVLHPQNVQKILLITDPPHLLRSVLSFQASGFTVIPHASPLPPAWAPERRLSLLLREYAGLIQYAVTNRFRQRSTFELEHPPIDVTLKLKTWNCKL